MNEVFHSSGGTVYVAVQYTIQRGGKGENESGELDNVGDNSAINTIGLSNHFISYSYYIMQIYVAMKFGLHY